MTKIIEDRTKAIEHTVLSLTVNDDMERLKSVRADIVAFIQEMRRASKPAPSAIGELKDIVEMLIHEKEFDDFYIGQKIISPVLGSLMYRETFALSDIRRYACVVGHATTYEQAHELALKLLNELEAFSSEKLCRGTKVVIHLNLLLRLIRAKRGGVDGSVRGESERLDELFDFHYDALKRLFMGRKPSANQAVAVIRKAIFHKGNPKYRNLAAEGFEMLQNTGRIGTYKMLFAEAKKFGLHSDDVPVPDYVEMLDRDAIVEEMIDIFEWLPMAELAYVRTAIKQLVDLRYKED